MCLVIAQCPLETKITLWSSTVSDRAHHSCGGELRVLGGPPPKHSQLTWLTGSFVGGLPRLAVLVARVVVVSMIEVDISDCMAVAVDSVVIEEGTSPTSLTFPTMAMLASFSAAIFRTFKPL